MNNYTFYDFLPEMGGLRDVVDNWRAADLALPIVAADGLPAYLIYDARTFLRRMVPLATQQRGARPAPQQRCRSFLVTTGHQNSSDGLLGD